MISALTQNRFATPQRVQRQAFTGTTPKTPSQEDDRNFIAPPVWFAPVITAIALGGTFTGIGLITRQHMAVMRDQVKPLVDSLSHGKADSLFEARHIR